jgi:hypothetical protein
LIAPENVVCSGSRPGSVHGTWAADACRTLSDDVVDIWGQSRDEWRARHPGA